MSFATPSMNAGIETTPIPFSNSGLVDYRESAPTFLAPMTKHIEVQGQTPKPEVTTMGRDQARLTMTLQPMQSMQQPVENMMPDPSSNAIPTKSKMKSKAKRLHPDDIARQIALNYLDQANFLKKEVPISKKAGMQKQSINASSIEPNIHSDVHDALLDHKNGIHKLDDKIAAMNKEMIALKTNKNSSLRNLQVHEALLDHKKGFHDLIDKIGAMQKEINALKTNKSSTSDNPEIASKISRLAVKVDNCSRDVSTMSRRLIAQESSQAKNLSSINSELSQLNQVQDNHKVAIESQSSKIYKISSCMNNVTKTTETLNKTVASKHDEMRKVLTNHRNEIRGLKELNVQAHDLDKQIKARRK